MGQMYEVNCSSCYGSGRLSCTRCGGSGRENGNLYLPDDPAGACRMCRGVGYFSCDHCGGKGYLMKEAPDTSSSNSSYSSSESSSSASSSGYSSSSDYSSSSYSSSGSSYSRSSGSGTGTAMDDFRQPDFSGSLDDVEYSLKRTLKHNKKVLRRYRFEAFCAFMKSNWIPILIGVFIGLYVRPVRSSGLATAVYCAVGGAIVCGCWNIIIAFFTSDNGFIKFLRIALCIIAALFVISKFI